MAIDYVIIQAMNQMINQQRNDQRRQRPIAVTASERELLDAHKRRYEEATGDEGDWGHFLATIVPLGLAAAGVYQLASARRNAPSTLVSCEKCGHDFVVALARGAGRTVEVQCPTCAAEIVVLSAKQTAT